MARGRKASNRNTLPTFNVLAYDNFDIELLSLDMKMFWSRVKLDLSFQSPGRWSPKEKTAYITALIRRAAPSKIVVANAERCLEAAKEKGDKEYFAGIVRPGYKFVSIDGNNRTTAINEYLNDKVEIAHGDYIGADGIIYSINAKNCKFSTHPKGFIENVLEGVTVTIASYTVATRKDISLLFNGINDGVKLNSQELRNAILVPISAWVRDFIHDEKNSKNNMAVIRKFLPTDRNLRRRDVDDAIAGLAVLLTTGPNEGISDSLKNAAYEDNSKVWANIDYIEEVLNRGFKILYHHYKGHKPYKGTSFLYNFFMVLDYLTREKKKIQNDEAFMEWMFNIEDKLRTDEKNKTTTPGGEDRTYVSCCMTTSAHELGYRFKRLLEHVEKIPANIAAKLDKNRTFSENDRLIMWKRQKGKCAITGATIPRVEINDTSKWHADHIIPYSRAGATSLDNAQLVSKTANLKKSNKLLA